MRGLRDAIVATQQGIEHPLVESVVIVDVQSFGRSRESAEKILGKSLELRLVEATIVWNKPSARAVKRRARRLNDGILDVILAWQEAQDGAAIVHR